jgi:hypothetical protein
MRIMKKILLGQLFFEDDNSRRKILIYFRKWKFLIFKHLIYLFSDDLILFIRSSILIIVSFDYLFKS